MFVDNDIEIAYRLEPRDITTYLRKTNIQTRCMKTAYFTRAFDLECGEDMLCRIPLNGLEREPRLDGVRHKFLVPRVRRMSVASDYVWLIEVFSSLSFTVERKALQRSYCSGSRHKLTCRTQ